MAEVEIMAASSGAGHGRPKERAALLAEVEAEGGKVSVVARRHRMSESVLHNWRAAAKAAAVVMHAPGATFIPLGVFGGPAREGPVMLAPPEVTRTDQARSSDSVAGGIEIALPNGARVSVDAFVNERALAQPCCMDIGCGRSDPSHCVVQAIRTEIGRPSSSMVLRAWTATPTSVRVDPARPVSGDLGAGAGRRTATGAAYPPPRQRIR